MALLSCNFRSQLLATSNILYSLRNLVKLKNSFIEKSREKCVLIYFRKFSNRFPYNIHSQDTKFDILCRKSLHEINYKYSSRWTRYSKTGYLVTTSRKKNKRTQIADQIRSKFQYNKLKETKRRFKRTIGEIKENVLTIPNGLCVLRIVSTPVLAYLVISEFYTVSLGLFIFAGFTDMIDGYIARSFPNQQSMIGSFLDPAADKLLISTLFITLTINGLIPVPLTSIILARDVCLMSAGFYIRYVSLPPPKTLSRYFDMSFVTAKLQPTNISKANTLIQISLAAASLAAPVFSYVDHFCLQILWYITGATTVLSAASYIYYKKSTYKLFKTPIKKNNNNPSEQ